MVEVQVAPALAPEVQSRLKIGNIFRVDTKQKAKTILLTGFDPFAGSAVNPSWEAVKAFEGFRIGDAVVHARQLPTVFGECERILFGHMLDLKPSIVIAVGQATGRPNIALERVAINIDDTPVPDNAGNKPVDVPVRRGGPPSYFSTLPIKLAVKALTEANVPAAVSNTAGTFVCNHLFYAMQDYIKRHDLLVRSGFVHIPLIPEQAIQFPGLPTMPLSQIMQGLHIILQAVLDYEKQLSDLLKGLR